MHTKNQIIEALGEAVGVKNVNLEFTENSEFGDYTTNIALQDKNSKETAEKLVSKLKTDTDILNIVDRIEVAGPGFINFWLKKDILLNNLIQIASEKEKYGTSDLGKGKLAIVEYSSPNIAKPFGVGHLRSTVIGDAIANLMEATGWKVMRDNHLGDWGTQFGKMIYAIKNWGDEKEIEKAKSPVAELVKLYVKFHEEAKKDDSLNDAARAWFKKLEENDVEAKRLWQKCIDWSWIEFNRIYSLMGIKFNKEFDGGRGLGESYFETRMSGVISELDKKNLLKVGEGGAKLVFFDNDKYPPLMIIKKDGATLYATRDLATDKYRLEKYNPEIIINEVGGEQSLYFKQLFELERILGWYKAGARVHVGHGLYLTNGKKMSTRGGESVQLEEVLNEAIERALKMGDGNPETAKKVGIGAIKYFDLSHQPQSNINFDWNSMFALEGNSAPYIQYTIARTNSVLAKIENFDIENSSKFVNYKLENEELAVVRTLIKFQEIIMTSAASYSPNLLCNYLFDLASKFNTFYNKYSILTNSDPEITNFRLTLTSGVGQVLKNGLKLLGIESPERM